MLSLFLSAIAYVLLEIVSWILHLIYLVRISMLVDTIRSKDELLSLRMRDYEYVIAEIFKRRGYKVRMSREFADGGNGLVLNDLCYVVAKKESYHHLLEVEHARKLSKHMQDNRICRGMIITLGDFKPNTKLFCHLNVITCINGNQLFEMLKEVQALNPTPVKLP